MAAADVTTVFTTVDELFKSQNTQCQFCKVATLATKEHLTSVHLKYSVSFTDGNSDRFCIPCHCEMKNTNRSHWHCPKCKFILNRKHSLHTHLQKHGFTLQHKKFTEESAR